MPPARTATLETDPSVSHAGEGGAEKSGSGSRCAGVMVMTQHRQPEQGS